MGLGVGVRVGVRVRVRVSCTPRESCAAAIEK